MKPRQIPRRGLVQCLAPAHARVAGGSLSRTIDRALLDRLIWVENAEPKVVAGTDLGRRGRDALAIHAGEPVEKGDYRLVIGTELEDLAGNSVATTV